jgi:hypothetical protein
MRNTAIVLLFALGVSACGGGYSQQAKDAAFRTAKNAKANTLVLHSYPTALRNRGDSWIGNNGLKFSFNNQSGQFEKGATKTFNMVSGPNVLSTNGCGFCGSAEAIIYPDKSGPVFIVEYPRDNEFAQFSRADFERIISGSFDIDAYFIRNRNALSARTAKVVSEKNRIARKKAAARKRDVCQNYGFKPETEGFANCLMQQDIAAKQSAEMTRLRAQAASAQRKAEEAEKEASDASTQALISTITANEAKRSANTIPYGKDCPWLNGCQR